MSEVLNLEPEVKLHATGKRALIEAELRKDAGRSDREIGRVCNVDHKTVSARRREMGIAQPLGNSPATATERRNMLIEGCKDFDKKYPPGPSDAQSAEEAVDTAIAEGKISYSTAGAGDVAAARLDISVQAAVDQVRGHLQRVREDRQTEVDKDGEANGEQSLVLAQREITIQHDERLGEWILRQRNWPDDDGVIIIIDENMQTFLDALCDRLGIASIRGSN
jgi:hypothetical protein